MDRRAQSAATWSFVVPAMALVVTWYLLRMSYRGSSAGTMVGIALADAATAAVGLALVWRARVCRGWAAAGAVANVVLVFVAVIEVLLAALCSALSGLTF